MVGQELSVAEFLWLGLDIAGFSERRQQQLVITPVFAVSMDTRISAAM
jgi:hypothetical protein